MHRELLWKHSNNDLDYSMTAWYVTIHFSTNTVYIQKREGIVTMARQNKRTVESLNVSVEGKMVAL